VYVEVTNGPTLKIGSIKKTSFKLPVTSSSTSLRIRVDNNKEQSIPKQWWMRLPQDNTPGDSTSGPMNHVFSIPSKLKIKEVEIEKLTLDDSTATITVLDALKNLQSASEVYATKLEGTGNTTSKNTAQINK